MAGNHQATCSLNLLKTVEAWDVNFVEHGTHNAGSMAYQFQMWPVGEPRPAVRSNGRFIEGVKLVGSHLRSEFGIPGRQPEGLGPYYWCNSLQKPSPLAFMNISSEAYCDPLFEAFIDLSKAQVANLPQYMNQERDLGHRHDAIKLPQLAHPLCVADILIAIPLRPSQIAIGSIRISAFHISRGNFPIRSTHPSI